MYDKYMKKEYMMNRIKDFFYNKNDIILVLIILAVAAFIIYTRITAIMDYPEQLAEKSAATATEETSSDDSSSSSVISVTIEEADTAATVSSKLQDAGLISSASDLEAYISSAEDPITFKTGTFQIPNGSSQEEILDIITD